MKAPYYNIDVVTNEDGTATVYHETNDNLDMGYASEFETWTTRVNSAERAIKEAGKSRIGISGIRVTVTVNGERV